jgi:hypothetical protein
VVNPRATTLGTYPKALRFSAKGQLKATLPIANLNTKKFCVRLVFKVDKAVTARQVLTESNAVPFSLYLIPGTGHQRLPSRLRRYDQRVWPRESIH